VTLLGEYALGSVEAGTDDWLGVAERIEITRIAEVAIEASKN
jgi:hypothetical protein